MSDNIETTQAARLIIRSVSANAPPSLSATQGTLHKVGATMLPHRSIEIRGNNSHNSLTKLPSSNHSVDSALSRNIATQTASAVAELEKGLDKFADKFFDKLKDLITPLQNTSTAPSLQNSNRANTQQGRPTSTTETNFKGRCIDLDSDEGEITEDSGRRRRSLENDFLPEYSRNHREAQRTNNRCDEERHKRDVLQNGGAFTRRPSSPFQRNNNNTERGMFRQLGENNGWFRSPDSMNHHDSHINESRGQGNFHHNQRREHFHENFQRSRPPIVATGANRFPCNNSRRVEENRREPRIYRSASYDRSDRFRREPSVDLRAAPTSNVFSSSTRSTGAANNNMFSSRKERTANSNMFNSGNEHRERPPHAATATFNAPRSAERRTTPNHEHQNTRHGSNIFDILDSSTAFAYPSDEPDPETMGYTLSDIWAIDPKQIRFLRQEIEAYNSNSERASMRDFMAWFSFYQARLKTKSTYEATFALTYSIGPDYTQPVINRYGPAIAHFNIQELATEYGREVYIQQGKNPAEVARRLEIGKDNITTRQGLLQRVVDITFCRAKQKYVVDFCYDLMGAIAYHFEKEKQQDFFLEQVHQQYPQIKIMSDILNGRKSITQLEYKMDILNNANLPKTSRECRRFAGWLIVKAMDDHYSFVGKFNDRRVARMVNEQQHNRRAVRQLEAEPVDAINDDSMTDANTESPSMAMSITENDKIPRRNRVHLPDPDKRASNAQYNAADRKGSNQENAMKNKVRVNNANTVTNSKSGGNKRKATEDLQPPRKKRFCATHGEGNHGNERCWVQHPELMEKPCTKHPNENHSIRQCFEMQKKAAEFTKQAEIDAIGIYQMKYEDEEAPSFDEERNEEGQGDSVVCKRVDKEIVVFSLQSMVNYRITAQTMKTSRRDRSSLCHYPIQAIDHETTSNDFVTKESPLLYFLNEQLNNNQEESIIYERRSLPFDETNSKNYRSAHAYITIEIANSKQQVLCDTGAALTIISEQLLNTISTAKIASLLHNLVLTPFNSKESPSTVASRNTTVRAIAMIPITLVDFCVEFPFYIFPGVLPTTIVGSDFLECFRSIIDLPNQRVDFEVPKGKSTEEVQSFMTGRIMKMMRLRKEMCIQRSINQVNFEQQYKNLVTKIKGCLAETTELLPNEWNTLILHIEKGVLQWEMIYNIEVIDDAQGFPSFELLQDNITTNASAPTDYVYLDVKVLHYRKFNKNEVVVNFILAKQEKIAQCELIEAGSNTHEKAFEFQPKPLFEELPLPQQSITTVIRDYSEEEIEAIIPEIERYVIKEGNERFVSPHPGLKIAAGDECMSDIQLALMSKTLSQVSRNVWHNEGHVGIFPGIPEKDVTIKIPLKNETPIQHKVRRLNVRLHQRCKEQLQKEKDMGLIEDSNSEFAFPILCVEKKNGKLRVCGDYRTLNEVAVADRYPLPLIDHLTAAVRGAKFISLFDLSSGFQQLFVYQPHRHRLAIITPFGQYQPIRLPYGYLNGPSAFQRQYDRTLGSMVEWGRAYIDDLTIHDAHNQRMHDFKVATVIHNICERGMVVNETKTTLLRNTLQYLGILISGEGTKAIIKHSVFDLLATKRHRNLLSLQQTVGALNWFRKFIPNYSQLVSPIYQALKAIGLYDLEQDNDVLDQICRPVITAVRKHLEQETLLSHPDYEAEKHLNIYIGDIAFACSLWQKLRNGKKEFIEYWSKRWQHDIASYSKEERYALATREAIKHFAALLQIAHRTFVYTSDHNFTQIATHPEMRTPRSAHYLVISHSYLLTFQTKPSEEFSLLNEQLPDQELLKKLESLTIAPLARFFRLTAEQVSLIPIVRTDGSFRKSVTQGGMGAIGVFWGINSPLNVSRWAVFAPFTNQRAELEAILCALEQAQQQKFTRLIIYSDSNYSLGLLATLTNKNCRCSTSTITKNLYKTKTPLPIANQDLLDKAALFLQGIRVYFQHIKRDLNVIADRLSKQPFQLLLQERQAERKKTTKKAESQNPLTNLIQPEATALGKESSADVLSAEISLMIHDNRLIPCEEFLTTERQEKEEQAILSDIFNYYCNSHQIFPTEAIHIRNSSGNINSAEVVIEDLDTDSETEAVEDTATNTCKSASSPKKDINLPSIPDYNQQHLVTILKVMSKHQILDDAVGSLRDALNKKDPTKARSEVAYHYNDAFIVPSSEILWVRMKGIDRILVPESLHSEIISLHHCSPYYAHHGGITATKHHILRLFFWRTLKADVAEFCSKCTVCLATKAANAKTPGLLTSAPLAMRPLQRLSVDCLTNLPITIGTRFQHVLVAVDSFTRFLFALPLQHLTAPLVVRALTSIFVLFGAPRVILTDKGGEFKNEVFAKMINSWGIRHIFTMTKNPQANGQAEVSVRIITQGLLTRLTEARQSHHHFTSAEFTSPSFTTTNSKRTGSLMHKWDTILPSLIYSHNTTYIDRIGHSPYELMFGRSPPLAHNLRIEEAKLLHQGERSFHDSLQQSLQTLHENAQQRQERFRSYTQRHYDKFRSPLSITKGDYVFVSPPHGALLRKLSPAREGPYKVLKVYRQQGTNEPTAVQVELSNKDGRQESRLYPRYRIRVLKGVNPPLYWKNLEKEAEHEMTHLKNWDFLSPKSIDDSNLICHLRTCNL